MEIRQVLKRILRKLVAVVPDEIYSAKGRTAEDAVLHQVIAYNLARQKHVSFVVASVDAA